MAIDYSDANKNFLKERKNSHNKKKNYVLLALLRLAIKIILFALVIVLIFTFIFGIFRMNDTTMTPSVNPGDLIFYYRLDKKCVVGDMVVFSYKGDKRIARVVALPGDTVDIEKSALKVNGNIQYEPKIYKETLAVVDGTAFPIKLKSNEYFILADNRDEASDSRLFGPVTDDDLYGKVFTLIRRRNI